MWGTTGPLDQFFRRVRRAEYDGIEAALSGSVDWLDPGDEPRLGSALAEHGLEFIRMILTVGPEGAITSGTATRPSRLLQIPG